METNYLVSGNGLQVGNSYKSIVLENDSFIVHDLPYNTSFENRVSMIRNNVTFDVLKVFESRKSKTRTRFHWYFVRVPELGITGFVDISKNEQLEFVK